MKSWSYILGTSVKCILQSRKMQLPTTAASGFLRLMDTSENFALQCWSMPGPCRKVRETSTSLVEVIGILLWEPCGSPKPHYWGLSGTKLLFHQENWLGPPKPIGSAPPIYVVLLHTGFSPSAPKFMCSSSCSDADYWVAHLGM